MPEPEQTPDVNAAAALALIQAENDYRSALVGPVSPDALPVLRAGLPEDGETGETVPRNAGGERGG